MALVEDFDRLFGGPDVHFLAAQGIGHAVEVLFKEDVVVDVDPGLLPAGKLVGRFRQGRQGGLVHLGEQFPARLAQMLHLPLVEFHQQFGNGLVELRQAEEGPVPQAGQDPALDHLHPHFHFGLVPWFAHPGWDHRHPVVPGKFLVGGVQVRLVQVRARHPRFEIVRHHHFRRPTQEGQRPHVRRNPVG